MLSGSLKKLEDEGSLPPPELAKLRTIQHRLKKVGTTQGQSQRYLRARLLFVCKLVQRRPQLGGESSCPGREDCTHPCSFVDGEGDICMNPCVFIHKYWTLPHLCRQHIGPRVHAREFICIEIRDENKDGKLGPSTVVEGSSPAGPVAGKLLLTLAGPNDKMCREWIPKMPGWTCESRSSGLRNKLSRSALVS